MAHFAKLNSSSFVVDIVVLTNETLLDGQGNETEQLGIDYLKSLTGHDDWTQASYNAGFRVIYPSIGDYYNIEKNRFEPQKTHEDYIWKEESYSWEHPLKDQKHEEGFVLNEATQEWVDFKGPPTAVSEEGIYTFSFETLEWELESAVIEVNN